MIRAVLSALPETSNDAEGLNFNVVGGKSCALRMVSRGCNRGLINILWRIKVNGIGSYSKRLRVQDSNGQGRRSECQELAVGSMGRLAHDAAET